MKIRSITSSKKQRTRTISMSRQQIIASVHHQLAENNTSDIPRDHIGTSELLNAYDPIDSSDLQYLAVLTHKLSVVNYQRKLWNVYLKCGTCLFSERKELQGYQQETTTRTLCIWPFPVTSMIIAQHYNDIIHENEITYDIYVDFIKKNLFQLDTKATLYKYEFNATKHRIETGSDKLTHKIDDFVQKNHQVTAVRLHFEARMELAEYVYLDQVLQFKFFQEKPNEQQIKLAQSICALQLQKEKSEQELILFKFGILYKKLPDSLNALEETPSTLITSITNSQQRERLSNNYMRIIQRAKADLMMALTQATEIKTQEHQTNFDTFMAQLWNDQRHLPQQERLSTTMLLLIDDRQKNILKCVKHIYALKPSFFSRV
ncbi:unnamed protein product [Rotaria sordida]|uniref:Uncharacterized protein n=1 Tax=Rotaria sordida TaxID=392033 RepID=A0A818XAM2_9BILA|nr:unnamed protein product [Rotaria sordida]